MAPKTQTDTPSEIAPDHRTEQVRAHVDAGRTRAAREAVADLFATVDVDAMAVIPDDEVVRVEGDVFTAQFALNPDHQGWHVSFQGTATYETDDVFIEDVDVEAPPALEDALLDVVADLDRPHRPRRPWF